MSLTQNLSAECLRYIIEYVNEDASIYSCLLVNRFWRDNSLPMLWSRPFNFSLTPHIHGVRLMNTYISCLSAEQKQYLNNNGIYIRNNSIPNINYLKHLRELNYDILQLFTRSWIYENNHFDRDPSTDLNEIIESLEPTVLEEYNDQTNRLLSCLFSMFIERSVNLTYFSFYSYDDELCLDLPELPTWMTSAASSPETDSSSVVSSHETATSLAASNNSLGGLRTFICEISGDLRLPNLKKFMEILSTQCKALDTIEFTWNGRHDSYVNNLIEIIRQQQQLKEIRLNTNNFNIVRVIEALNTERHNLVIMQIEDVNGTSFIRFTIIE
ncbi:hypothetical protein C1645_821082 [Glomus cerebriforme]|uniref:F-box domain-containing protein n=1 Tax=Glomus cerebriforme TaxID=658196 RepID=A0A397T2Y3_9GLOM|nr:hypothetical protein C1645_821082 [Glomus cerebriforme]